MAKLIKKKIGDKYYGDYKDWLIGNRFQLSVYLDNVHCSFFVTDQKSKINSLELIPRLGKELGLFEEPDIALLPSIDTCGIVVPILRHDEIFNKIEKYLLDLESKG